MEYQFGEDVVQRTNTSDVREIAKDILRRNRGQVDSFFVMMIDDLINQHKMWEEAHPRIKPYYAVKCNDSTVVLKVLAALGANFDCASQGEISRVLSLGVEPNRIIYANPNKQMSHIEFAASVGVDLMTFDNESELANIKRFHPGARLLLRIVADAQNIVHKMSNKFGVSENVAKTLVQKCRSLDLDLVGVCFHVGSGCSDLGVFDEALSFARRVYDYCLALGIRLRYVDIGGGFTSRKFHELSVSLQRYLAEHFEDVDVEIISEPGHFFVNNAYSLVAQVNSIRDDSDSDQPVYFINNSTSTSFSLCLHEISSFQILPLDNITSGHVKSSIHGHSCNPRDIISTNCFLPRLRIGDWLLFTNIGAYTLNLTTHFQGFDAPKVYHCSKNSWEFLEENVSELNLVRLNDD